MGTAILYKANETQFNHLGLGPLNDAVSILVTEERNGIFELEMKYPVSGKVFHELKNDRIIKADAGHKLKDQRFKIIRISKPLKGIVTVYAEHVSYLTQDLALKPKVTFSGNARQALSHWKANLVDDNPLTVWSDISTTGKINWTIDEVENARRALGGVQGSILDVYGGEYLFDNYDIYLYQKRGVNSELLIAYGRNLVDLEQEEEIANTYTSIYPYSIYTDDDGNERMVTLPEYYIDSEHVDKYARRKILVVDFTTDEIETVSALRNAARRYIKDNDVGVPRVNLKIQYIDLAKTLDYKHLALYEEVNLCDNVMIYFEKYDINTTAKVIKVVWDVLNERYDSIEVGEARASLSQAIDTVVDGKVHSVEKLAMQTLRTADGKNTIYFGLEEPTGDQLKENDIWYRIVDGEFTRTYRYDGVTWQLIIDMDSAEAKAEAQQARERANEAVERANQATEDANTAIGQAQAGFDLAQESIIKSDDAFKKAQEGFDLADDAFKKAQENATHIDSLALRITGRNLISHDRDRWLYSKISDNWQTNEFIKIDDGTAYTISNYSEVPLNVTIHLYDGYTYSRSFDFTNDSVTFTTNKEDRYVIVVDYADDDFLDLLGTNIKFKLEKGEVATEWTIHDVDPYKQFTTITATVDGLQTTVSDVQGNVSSLTQLSNAMQAQLKDVEGNVNTLTLTSQGLQSSVSELQSEMDGLSYENRNLIRNSGNFSDREFWDRGRVVEIDGYKTIEVDGENTLNNNSNPILEPDTYYVYSGWLMSEIDLPSSIITHVFPLHYQVRYNGNSSGGRVLSRLLTDNYPEIIPKRTWFKIAVLIKTRKDNDLGDIVFSAYVYESLASRLLTNNKYWVRDFKLEKGTKATPWSPAPEDIDRNFSEITQKIDSITTRVGDAEGNLSTLQQTSQSLAGRISDAEGNLTTLTATVSGLQTTVSDVQGNVSSLTQLSTVMQSRLTDAEGNISTLTQTSNSLVSRISSLANPNLITHDPSEWDELFPYFYQLEVKVEPNEIYTFKDFSTLPLEVLRVEDYQIDQGETYTFRSNSSGEVNIGVFDAGFLEKLGTEFKFKLEKGDVATAWTAHDEDIYTQYSQLSDAINLRVVKGDVINQINLDTSGVLISGKKLILDGDTTVTGQFKVGNANITSIDAGKVTVGDLVGHSLVGGKVIGGYIEQQSGNRRLEMYNGIIDSFYNGQLAMRFGQYSLEFYNKINDRIGRLVPIRHTVNPDTRGLGLIIDEDVINIGYEKGGLYRAVFRSSDNNKITTVSGPYNNANDGSQLRLVANRRQVSEDKFYSFDQPAIVLDQSEDTNNIDIYYGGFNRRNAAEVRFRHRTSANVSNTRLVVHDQGITVNNNYLDIGRNSSDEPQFRANAIRRRTSTNDANVRINPDSSSLGLMFRTTSSEKQKVNIESIPYEHALKVLDLTPSTWYDKHDCETYAEYLSCGDRSLLADVEPIRRIPGLIAEDVERAGLHEFVEYANDEIVNINSKLWTLLIPITRQHQDDIEWLKLENQYLKQKLELQDKRIKQLEGVV